MGNIPTTLAVQQRLLSNNRAVALQFRPDKREKEDTGNKITFKGIIETGIPGLERMYPDRAVILPVSQCPAYCRFCFRKFYKKGPPLPYKDIDRAIKYIKKHRQLKSILISGGDPLLDLERLEYIIAKLRQIGHIAAIRIGSRSPMYCPELITPKLVRMLKKYHSFSQQKPIEFAVHFNHPAELSKESTNALTRLTESGLRVYNQSVLLKNVNDNAKTLARLYRSLNSLGVEIYYLFHCDPVKGIQHLRTTVQEGINIKKELRQLVSGRINPAYMVDTRVGKVELGVDGYIEKKIGQYLWIKTPYNIKTFKQIDPDFSLPAKEFRIDKLGFISALYLDNRC